MNFVLLRANLRRKVILFKIQPHINHMGPFQQEFPFKEEFVLQDNFLKYMLNEIMTNKLQIKHRFPSKNSGLYVSPQPLSVSDCFPFLLDQKSIDLPMSPSGHARCPFKDIWAQDRVLAVVSAVPLLYGFRRPWRYSGTIHTRGEHGAPQRVLHSNKWPRAEGQKTVRKQAQSASPLQEECMSIPSGRKCSG